MKKPVLWIIVAGIVILGVTVAVLITNHTRSTNSQTTSDATATNQVTISDFSFQPTTVKVKAGDTVTWTNLDPAEHTVTADISSSDTPDSPNIGKGQIYSFKFKKRGTYNYSCTMHPRMRGKVIVE